MRVCSSTISTKFYRQDKRQRLYATIIIAAL
jgi:hypothetical protein